MPGQLPAVPDITIAQASINNFRDLGHNMVIVMTAVALAESSGIPDNLSPGAAAGGAGGFGLWQIENNHADILGQDFYTTGYKTPDTNAAAARKIYNAQGITAWSAFTNGSYQQYLSRASDAVMQIENGAAAAGVNSLYPANTYTQGATKDTGPFANLEGAMWMGGGAILIVLGIVMLNKQAGNPIGKTVGGVAKIAEVAAL